MTWFRVDDGIGHHPKLEGLEREPLTHALAVAAWTLMGVDCAKRRTDGQFSEARLRRVLPWPEDMVVRARGALIESGLWEQRDAGIAFHDWTDYQPSKAELDEERRAATERQRRWRESRRRARHASTNGVTDAVTNTVSHAPPSTSMSTETGDGTGASSGDASVTAPRPVPSRPVPSEDRESAPDLGALAEYLRAGAVEAYRSLTIPPPRETRLLSWPGWAELARWVREKARLSKRDERDVARQAFRSFMRSAKAKREGWPITFLVQNPAEYWGDDT